MAYASWSVVFGEQPSAAKWNILGTNDASFNDGTGIDNGTINFRQLAAGAVVQVVSTNYSNTTTGTGTIPVDNTIPQISEGNEFMTQAITPKATTHVLLIEAQIMFANSAINNNTVALFQDATANALYATVEQHGTANAPITVSLKYRMAAGTTSSTTFRIRVGGSSANTVTFNGSGAVALYGGIPSSNITVTEYKA